MGGFISCQLNSCCAFAFKEGNYTAQPINIEGPFTSMRYNEKDDHVLVSCRANHKNPYVRHLLCSIRKNEDSIEFNQVHIFNAGTAATLLSRPCYVNLPNDTLIVANNESQKKITAWSVSTGEVSYNLSMPEPMVDACSFSHNDTLHKAVLTSNSLQLYEFKNSFNKF